jgi:hypothetical protein
VVDVKFVTAKSALGKLTVGASICSRLLVSPVLVEFSMLTFGCNASPGQTALSVSVSPWHDETAKRVTAAVSVNSAFEPQPMPYTAPSKWNQLPANPNMSSSTTA